MFNTPAISAKQQNVVGFLILAFGIFIAYQFAGWISSGNVTILKYCAIIATIVLIGSSIVRNWRNGFYVFLAWLLFEDLIRKHLGNNMAIFFAKDALVLLVYIALATAIRKKEEPAFRPMFLIPISLFFWFAVLQLFNPYSPSIFYGLLGIKLYFYYAPLMFVGYALVRNDTDLRRFLVASLVLSAIIAGLGIVQSIVGPDFLNPANLAPELRPLGQLDKITPITHERLHLPASVFVSTGRYSQYLALSFVVGLAAAGYFLLHTMKRRWIVFVSLGIVSVGVALCGSRGAVMLSLISAAAMSVAFLWGAPWKNQQVYKTLQAIRRAGIVIAFCIGVAALTFPQLLGGRVNYYTETLLPTSSAYELSDRAWDYPIRNLAQAFSEPHWIVGYGIGTVSLGTQYVARIADIERPGNGVESGYGSILIELGIFGLILWLLWTTVLMIHCWRLVKSVRQTRIFPVAFGIFWFAFLLLFPQTFGSLNNYEDYVLNAYLWLMIGILFKLPDLLVPGPVMLAQSPAIATNRLQAAYSR
jgi:general stress protein CsbA